MPRRRRARLGSYRALPERQTVSVGVSTVSGGERTMKDRETKAVLTLLSLSAGVCFGLASQLGWVMGADVSFCGFFAWVSAVGIGYTTYGGHW